MNVAIRIGRTLFDALSQDKKREFFASRPAVNHFNNADVLDEADVGPPVIAHGPPPRSRFG